MWKYWLFWFLYILPSDEFETPHLGKIGYIWDIRMLHEQRICAPFSFYLDGAGMMPSFLSKCNQTMVIELMKDMICPLTVDGRR